MELDRRIRRTPIASIEKNGVKNYISRSYGVMAITLDFESNNPSSNLGRTSNFFAF